MDRTLKEYLTIYLNQVNEETPTTFAAVMNNGGTTFEDASNLLQIGVFAPKNHIHKLLVIMRMLVDENYDLLDDFFADLEETDEFKYENLSYDDFVAKFDEIAVDSINEYVITASELKDLVDDSKYADTSRNWRTRRPNISSVFWKASDLAKHLVNVPVTSVE